MGADKVGERIAAAVAASAAPPSLTYLYDSDLDWTGHRYGVASSQWLQQLAMIDAEAEQLREALPADRRLVVVADHGMVDSPGESRVRRRRAHRAARRGRAASAARPASVTSTAVAVRSTTSSRRWTAVLDDAADVLTRGDAIGRGWFGPVDARVLPRLGDVVVACRDDSGVFSSRGSATRRGWSGCTAR